MIRGLLNFIGNIGKNIFHKYLGTGLTDAQREANAWTASREDLAFERNVAREDLAWERTMEADNTKFQRQIADMQAAGLNPMLAVSGGVSAPAASSSSPASSSQSVSPASGNLGDLLSLVTMVPRVKAEVANIKADTQVKEAQADKLKEDERGQTLQNDYFEMVRGLRAEGETLQNDMTRYQMRMYEQNINESRSRVEKNLSDISKNESDISVNSARHELMIAEAILARANADNIIYLRPFVARLHAANTDKARADAGLALVESAYQQGLIDNGAIEAAVASTKMATHERSTSARKNEIDNRAKEFAYQLKTGKLREAADDAGDWRSSVLIGLYEGLNNVATSVLGKW